jgi:hypothetical protein
VKRRIPRWCLFILFLQVVSEGDRVDAHRLCGVQREYHLLRSHWRFPDACRGRLRACAKAIKADSFLRRFDSSKFPSGNWSYSKKAREELVEYAWSAILYAKYQGREPGEFRYILLTGKFMCVSSDYFFLPSPELMKKSEMITSMRPLRRAETVNERRLLHEGPLWLRQVVIIRRRRKTYLRRLSRPMRLLLRRCECLRADLL